MKKSYFLNKYKKVYSLVCSKNEAKLKVIVTGPPRSGTSFLTSMVSLMGFNLGPEKWLKNADEFNRYGYYECLPLLNISDEILRIMGGNYNKLPNFSVDWINNLIAYEKQIEKIVKKGRIELYKDNKLLVLGSLYDKIFPNAKWIFIERDLKTTFDSEFNMKMTFEEWKKLRENRLQIWYDSEPSKKALYVNYDEFKRNIKSTIFRIEKYLNIVITDEQRENCIDFFRPRR